MLYIRHLTWDDWNVAHIARHEVTRDEVGEVWHSDYIVREGYNSRIMLIGPTTTDRILAVVLESEGDGIYYVVTARPADRKERRTYREEQRKGDGRA